MKDAQDTLSGMPLLPYIEPKGTVFIVRALSQPGEKSLIVAFRRSSIPFKLDKNNDKCKKEGPNIKFKTALVVLPFRSSIAS